MRGRYIALLLLALGALLIAFSVASVSVEEEGGNAAVAFERVTVEDEEGNVIADLPVSYTHLTLPPH